MTGQWPEARLQQAIHEADPMDIAYVLLSPQAFDILRHIMLIMQRTGENEMDTIRIPLTSIKSDNGAVVNVERIETGDGPTEYRFSFGEDAVAGMRLQGAAELCHALIDDPQIHDFMTANGMHADVRPARSVEVPEETWNALRGAPYSLCGDQTADAITAALAKLPAAHIMTAYQEADGI